jgi:UDP-N-acetylglucosamine:LPS N-acetylglucosamine transferase
MSVHGLWIHPGVDSHLAVHDIPAQQARNLGAGPTFAVRPAVPASFGAVSREPRCRAQARRSLGLPGRPRRGLALVTGGAHGIGRLFESARELEATGLVTPVVLCGRNSRLLSRVQRHPGMLGLGWVTDVPELLTAVDVVVQNSGGMTSLEAQAAGVPMVTYRPIAGHGEANAAALDLAGLAPWARSMPELYRALLDALEGPFGTRGVRASAPDVVDLLFPAPALIA